MSQRATGTLEYTYENHNFFFNTTQLDSRVVSQKRITFNQGESASSTELFRPIRAQAQARRRWTVLSSDTSATHYAYESTLANRWRIGLETSLASSDGSLSATRTWTYHEISTTSWSVLGVNMGTAKGSLVYR